MSVFVDTGAWFAYFVRRDPDHSPAREWVSNNDFPLITSDDFTRAWRVFVQFSDKGWSFTDCTSKMIMERLSISTAFSFDEHFDQFGSIVRVP